MNQAAPVNALSIDVEDYFQVSAFKANVKKSSWADRESRVERNTEIVLEKMAAANVSATFFTLGWIAEHFPQVVRAIHQAGHEIASHGYSHDLIYEQSPAVFREETRRTKALLEDITGQPIRGYRAASYSITNESLWALDILAEEGIEYDSSIFPILHDRYGLIGGPEAPHKLELPSGHTLLEFPLNMVKLGPLRIPVSGGGYFRLYPYWLSRMLLKQFTNANRAFMFYLHPWEFDPNQPRLSGSLLSRFRHYQNLRQCSGRFESLLRDFRFDTVANVLDGLADSEFRLHRYAGAQL